MGLFEVPNLDDLTCDSGEMLLAAQILSRLAEYAHGKAMAMKMREGGNVAGALAVEKHLERQYRALPKWARW